MSHGVSMSEIGFETNVCYVTKIESVFDAVLLSVLYIYLTRPILCSLEPIIIALSALSIVVTSYIGNCKL